MYSTSFALIPKPELPQEKKIETNILYEHRCKNPGQDICELNLTALKGLHITIKWELP